MNKIVECYNIPVVVSTHPRTKRLFELVTNTLIDPRIRFLKPFVFFYFVKLQMDAKCTLSDSGTISEESAILNFPAISLRQSIERPEAQDAGTIILSGFDHDIVLNSIDVVIKEQKIGGYSKIAEEYTITNTSWRVLKLIMGNTGLSNKWWGIEV